MRTLTGALGLLLLSFVFGSGHSFAQYNKEAFRDLTPEEKEEKSEDQNTGATIKGIIAGTSIFFSAKKYPLKTPRRKGKKVNTKGVPPAKKPNAKIVDPHQHVKSKKSKAVKPRSKYVRGAFGIFGAALLADTVYGLWKFYGDDKDPGFSPTLTWWTHREEKIEREKKLKKIHKKDPKEKELHDNWEDFVINEVK